MPDTRTLHLDAAAAAAERSRTTRRRLIELQERLERLRAGKPPTQEDVARARIAVEGQRRAYAQAQRRMATARSSRQRHSGPLWSALPAAASPGEDGPYRRLRQAFVALSTCRLGGSDAPSDSERRRQLATALVEKAVEPARSWTEALCQLALSVLPGTAGSGVSTYDEDGVAHPVAAADDRSAELEEVQQVLGEGPGGAAHIDGRAVIIDDLSQVGQRWPGYVAAVRDLGVVAVWSLPVAIDGGLLGSLTLYRADHHGGDYQRAAPGPDLDEAGDRRGWTDAVMLAELAASTMIIDADLLADHRPGMENPSDLVDIASGVLAVRTGLRVDQAFALLRGHAFSTGRRVSDVAADVVTGSLDLG